MMRMRCVRPLHITCWCHPVSHQKAERHAGLQVEAQSGGAKMLDESK